MTKTTEDTSCRCDPMKDHETCPFAKTQRDIISMSSGDLSDLVDAIACENPGYDAMVLREAAKRLWTR